jgi:hypothetical protein
VNDTCVVPADFRHEARLSLWLFFIKLHFLSIADCGARHANNRARAFVRALTFGWCCGGKSQIRRGG